MEEIAQFAAAAQEEIRHDVGWLFRGAIRVILECLLEQEVKEMVGARRYERLGSRKDQVEALRRSPIDKPVPYLYLDATFLDARWARSVENVSALVAYGVDSSGHRRLLGISIGTEESEASWSELLGQLCERGLSGVELVIADEHRGLANAVRRQLPEARRQRFRAGCDNRGPVPRRL